MGFVLFLLLIFFSLGKAQSIEQVTALLQTAPCAQQYIYAITPYEWRELDINLYIKRFDRTHTCCGRWGLEQLTRPITDYHELLKRQQGLVYFKQSPDHLYQWYKCLDALASEQEHLFAYYDQHDQLTYKVKQLYFTWFSSILNKNQLLLDYAYVVDVGSSVITLIGLLSINSFFAECVSAYMQQRPIDIAHGVFGGLSHVIDAHRIDDCQYQQLKSQGGFEYHTKQHLSTPLVYNVANLVSSCINKITSAVNAAGCLFSKPASAQIVFKGTLGDKWSFYNEQCNIPSVVAACLVAGNVLYVDQCLIIRIDQHYRKLRNLFYTYRSLQHRLTGVARFMHYAKELIVYAQSVSALADNSIIQRAYALCTDDHSDLALVLQNLQSSSYAQEKDIWYSRGHALITHALINDYKQQLLCILQAIGIIDAYVSIYRVYDEYQGDQNKFCLVDFTAAYEPFFIFQDAWLPTLSNQQELQSCVIGSDQPRNILLTGPNGSGKSCVLKLIGGLAVLAQSWTIVPAIACSMSVFSAICTSFNPPEDITRGVSTFMAQKERLDTIGNMVVHDQGAGCSMLLVDEPYRGTVEAEASQRCYQWCKNLVQYPHCMQIIASHLQKPLELGVDKSFALKQLEVLAYDDGTFVRTFKLIDGVSSWWFDDVGKRIAFVDAFF